MFFFTNKYYNSNIFLFCLSNFYSFKFLENCSNFFVNQTNPNKHSTPVFYFFLFYKFQIVMAIFMNYFFHPQIVPAYQKITNEETLHNFRADLECHETMP